MNKRETPLIVTDSRGVRRELVGVASCPEFDAYLSGKKWTIAGRESKILVNVTELAQHRIDHAVAFRLKKMRHSISARKRLRGESKKEKVTNLMKDAAIRHYVSKQHLPAFLIQPDDLDLSHRAALAHARGVNPLLDNVDFTILLCWDQLNPIFQWPFFGFAYADKELPGLSKWPDRASSLFIGYVAKDETFYSQAATPTHERPHLRPYHRYKGRRKELDLHPDKRPVIEAAYWDRDKDVLRVASKADGWAWEIYRFYRGATIIGTEKRVWRSGKGMGNLQFYPHAQR